MSELNGNAGEAGKARRTQVMGEAFVERAMSNLDGFRARCRNGSMSTPGAAPGCARVLI